jgi:hypothetical protein
MVTFSNDVDILRYEPILFGELHLPGQVIATGTGGTLTGTTFTAEDADFVNAQISAGGVIYLQSADGTLDGAFEIVSADSAIQLTVSIVRTSSDDEPIAPPAAGDISYRIGTFKPQADEAAFQLMEYFSIKPGNPASSIEVQDILDTEVLKRASVFTVISTVYAMFAGKAEDENFWKKNLHYQKLFEKARQRVRLSIGSSADGTTDVTRIGASVRLVRD